MKIIVVGCGKIGTSIATELNAEGHDVVVVDINNEAVQNLSDSLDVLGITGNGATYNVLMEAGVDNADVVIAAAARDEVNIYTCLMAKCAGAQHTIARVRNPEYSHDLFRVKEHLGLSMEINPEKTAANEISRLLRFSGSLEVDSFSKGKVELIKIKLPENSVIIDKKISDIDILKGRVRICSVERNNEYFVPNGDFVLHGGDLISIVSAADTASKFFRKINATIGRSKNVVLLGGGKISYYLAKKLLEVGTSVKIIEKNEERCHYLAESLSNVIIIHGDCMDQQLLLSEGIQHATGVVALMDYDEENILSSMYVKSVSDAAVITKVNNTSFDHMLSKFGFDRIIHPKNLIGEYIARYIRAVQNTQGSNVETLYRLNDDKIEALEFNVRTESKVTGIPIKNLNLKDDLQIICIIRGSKLILPQGSDTITRGDMLVIMTKQKGLTAVEDILKH